MVTQGRLVETDDLACPGDAGLEYLMVDGSIVRVHQHGAAKKNSTDFRGHRQVPRRFEHPDSRDSGCSGVTYCVCC